MEGYRLDVDNTCKKCYIYEGECLFKCPLKLIPNEEDLRCISPEYEKLDNIPLILCCGFCIILFVVLVNFCFQRVPK